MSESSRPAPTDADPASSVGATNVVVLHGVLSRDPDVRTLPSGDDLVAYEVTVARPDGPAESAPVVWIDPPRRRAVLTAGDAVVVVGRVRRRFYRAGGVTQSRTEVFATKVVRSPSPSRGQELVRRALAAFEELPGPAVG
ncbi:single-stranded DNA-binding protein [Rhabdothermincola salaria]|uniref:single-stranded DNA-binding protein n=1 Tax=Rhabdothermincola salaria TaxID=2903142 RepID=UPI001E4019E1|nr:single-stranded DNA-binding protein [Rhabdothermincola salaria]MCD9623148.1 single-stranded DNA-binding protein [Rhabdothermincola salaria]